MLAIEVRRSAWVANLKRTHKIVLDVGEKPRDGFTLLKRDG